jgi:hypothetical protein
MPVTRAMGSRAGWAVDRRSWWARVDASAESILAVHDAEIDALARDERLTLAAVWQKRGGLELQVAGGFAAIASELLEHGAVQPVMALVGQAVRDEVHHAEISVELAARYRGDDVVWPAPAPVHIPKLAPATGALRATLHMIAMCCINETVACAILEAAFAQAKSPLVRAGIQSILSDEIDHARAGWAHLASPFVDAETKRALPQWLKRLLAGKLDVLLQDESPLPGEAFPHHGMLARETFREVVHAALDDVVLPGFARAGIDTEPARAWATAGSS